jgi:glucose-1-phosphate thymidylyltransferase
MDAGTPDAMLDAGKYVQSLERNQKVMAGFPEEIAINNGWINRKDLDIFLSKHAKTDYGRYITSVLDIKEGKV